MWDLFRKGMRIYACFHFTSARIMKCAGVTGRTELDNVPWCTGWFLHCAKKKANINYAPSSDIFYID